MPVAVTQRPCRRVPVEPTRKRWRGFEYEVLGKTGLLDQDPVELMELEWISQVPRHRPHVLLYARTAIRKCRVFNISGRRPLAHRDLHNSPYKSTVVYGEDEAVAPLAALFCMSPVSDAFLSSR